MANAKVITNLVVRIDENASGSASCLIQHNGGIPECWVVFDSESWQFFKQRVNPPVASEKPLMKGAVAGLIEGYDFGQRGPIEFNLQRLKTALNLA